VTGKHLPTKVGNATDSAFSVRTAAVFALAFLAFFLLSRNDHTAYNNFVLLANAWLHGHVWIDKPESWIDALPYNGHWYIINAPVPAVLLLPLVAFYGANANQTIVSVLCGAIAVAAADVLFARMGASRGWRDRLTLFFALGTVLWWCSANGAVWMYAHVVGIMFAMLALAEWYGSRRPWLIAVLLACAVYSRFPMVLAVPPLLVWMFLAAPPERRWRDLMSFAYGFVPFVLASLAYNYMRYHSVTDVGYTLFYHMDAVGGGGKQYCTSCTYTGSPTGSPFALQFLPKNLYSFFMLPPQLIDQPPYLQLTGQGVALTFTSPLLLLALAAPRRLESLVMWAAAFLVAVPSLLYYLNGCEQFGMRHSLDFTPFLIVLLARGVERVPPALSWFLLLFSLAANLFGMIYPYTPVPCA
jgi:hypothetical protein